MKKLTLISLFSALSCSSMIHAGGMGDQSIGGGLAGFFALEGGYTVNSIDNDTFIVTGFPTITSVKTKQNYTGRVGAGMIGMMDDQVGMSLELGWGYYGRTTLNSAFVGVGDLNIQNTLTGFDALVGIAYIQPNFSVSLKGGGLIQNVTRNTTANGTFALFTSTFFDSYTLKSNQTAVLPEIKLGAAYNFDSNWALTVAFMSAFGSSPKTTSTFDTVGVGGIATYNSNNLNPTQNSLLLGIQYTC